MKTKPLTQMKKFYAVKDEVVDRMIEIRSRPLSPETRYTYIRPHKSSLIYFGCPGLIEEMSFCIEMEYNGVLMIFFYDPISDDRVEYTFAFNWSEDEIEDGTDEFFIDVDIDDAGLFQESTINDIQFLTVELHQALVKYCLDVREALRTKLGHDESV